MLSTTKLRRLLYLFVIYLLTIDSDAALVSSTFEITHSSNFESRWLLSSDHLENSYFSPAARIVPAPNDLPYQIYDTQTTQKILLEEYSFISSRGRSLRRRTLQDLMVRFSSVRHALSFVVRAKLGLHVGPTLSKLRNKFGDYLNKFINKLQLSSFRAKSAKLFKGILKHHVLCAWIMPIFSAKFLGRSQHYY